jgi:hypothetical protein
MNEHIKKLFDRALDQAVPETWTTLSHEQITKLSEVFAELIVRGNIQTLRGNGYDDAAQCLQDIHFGIEDPV